MKKDERELNQKEQLIESKVNAYKKDFEGLNEKQQTLLAYRKIIELRKNEVLVNDFLMNTAKNEKESSESLSDTDEILAIIKASDFNCSFLESIILYAMSKDNKEYMELYSDSLDSYNKILENYRSLAEELNINNSLELSNLFTYMLWNGYYSVDKKHSYKLQDRLLLPGKMGSFDVIKGQGVCLAYAKLLQDYLATCDKKAALLQCKVPTSKKAISCNYRPEIERSVKNSVSSMISSKALMIFFFGLVNKIGNHAVTLIEENDKLFVYDPTNLYVLNIIDENKASIINGRGEFKIKPNTTLLLNPDSDPNLLFEKLLFYSKERVLTRKEVIFSFENTMELIKSNISLLDDAYDNIHPELEIIDKQTDEIGGHLKALKKIRKMQKNK